MRVALYVRRSTNEELQPDSLATQEELLRAFAEREGHCIVAVFADSASGRTAERSEFQNLINMVSSPHAVEAVLVRDVTRWGRFENVDESAYWEFFLLTHGVRVIYVEEPFRSDSSPYASLLKVLKRVQAAEFIREKSRMIQYSKARVVRGGYYPGGAPPYALRRAGVRPDGTVAQQFQPGERKAVGNLRIKLMPSGDGEVEVVRRIFNLFVGGVLRSEIVRVLNGERVPAPGQRGWKYSEITKILRNPAYAGIAKVKCRPSENFPGGETILTPNSWPAIVDEDTWTKAQARLDASLHKRTPAGIAEQLRASFEKHGFVDKHRREADLPCWETFLRNFTGGHREALALAYAEKIADARTYVAEELRKTLSVACEPDAETILINGLLRVQFKSSFPRLVRGSLFWEFAFEKEEAADVTIGLAFAPPPDVRVVQTFLFHNAHFKRRKRVIHINLSGRSRSGLFRRSLEQIRDSLLRNLYRDATLARQMLAMEAEKHPVLDLPRIAKRLGWTGSATYAVYRSLIRIGKKIPPLKNAKGRRVRVTCSSCGDERMLTLRRALILKTDVCATCWRSARGSSVEVQCPSCGRVRIYWQSVLPRLSAGVQTHCVECVQQSWTIRAATARSANNARRRDALMRLAHFIADTLIMKVRDVQFRRRQNTLAPSIVWREKTHGQFGGVQLVCSQRTSLLLSQTSDETMRRIATRASDRRQWKKTRRGFPRITLDKIIRQEVTATTKLRLK